MSRDYYSILGVTKTSTPEEIKSTYRDKCKIYHPDVAPTEKKIEYESTMKDLNEAYSILSDPEKRKQYDNPRPQFQQRMPPGMNVDINEMLRNIMGGMSGIGGNGPFRFNFGGQPPNQQQNFQQIFQIQLEINVFILILGGQIEVPMPNGEKKKINIPPNTPLNARLRLKTEDNKSEILIQLIPNIPPLTPEQLVKLKEMFSDSEVVI